MKNVRFKTEEMSLKTPKRDWCEEEFGTGHNSDNLVFRI